MGISNDVKAKSMKMNTEYVLVCKKQLLNIQETIVQLQQQQVLQMKMIDEVKDQLNKCLENTRQEKEQPETPPVDTESTSLNTTSSSGNNTKLENDTLSSLNEDANEQFNENDYLNEEQDQHSPHTTSSSSSSSSDSLNSNESSTRHKCQLCGKVFGSGSAVQIHMRSHTGERPFKCNICQNRFSTKGNLKVHFLRLHKDKYDQMDVRPILDETQSEVAQQQQQQQQQTIDTTIEHQHQQQQQNYNLLAAAAAVASTNPLLAAATFPYNQFSYNYFAASNSMSTYMNNILSSMVLKRDESLTPPVQENHETTRVQKVEVDSLSEELMPFKQRRSDSSSSGSSQQQQQQQQPQHVCVYCQKWFSSASALDIHIRIHTGEKPFKCTICSRAFTTKGNLKVHMGTHSHFLTASTLLDTSSTSIISNSNKRRHEPYVTTTNSISSNLTPHNNDYLRSLIHHHDSSSSSIITK